MGIFAYLRKLKSKRVTRTAVRKWTNPPKEGKGFLNQQEFDALANIEFRNGSTIKNVPGKEKPKMYPNRFL